MQTKVHAKKIDVISNLCIIIKNSDQVERRVGIIVHFSIVCVCLINTLHIFSFYSID
jgi:hypothetical protein